MKKFAAAVIALAAVSLPAATGQSQGFTQLPVAAIAAAQLAPAATAVEEDRDTAPEGTNPLAWLLAAGFLGLVTARRVSVFG